MLPRQLSRQTGALKELCTLPNVLGSRPCMVESLQSSGHSKGSGSHGDCRRGRFVKLMGNPPKPLWGQKSCLGTSPWPSPVPQRVPPYRPPIIMRGAERHQRQAPPANHAR